MCWTSPDFRSGWCRRTAKNDWQLQGSTQRSMAFRSYRQKKKSLKMRAIYEKISGLHPVFDRQFPQAYSVSTSAYGRKCTDTEPVKLAETASAVDASFAGAGVQRGSQPFVPGCRGGSALLGSRGNAHWRVERQPLSVSSEPFIRVKGETPCPGKVDACVNLYWVLPDAEFRRFCGFAALPGPGTSSQEGGKLFETDKAQWALRQAWHLQSPSQ